MNHDHQKSSYLPLIVLISVITISSLSLTLADEKFHLGAFSHYFMGLFFVMFAAFKLFDIKGFADGFQMYDIIAKSSRKYAYIYPFIELSLGLSYLGGFYPFYTNLITFIVMLISAIGVIFAIVEGKKLKCSCLGTILNVPLSTVTIVENLGMGIMAFIALI